MPEVFLSYRQTSDPERQRVRAFAERLRSSGIRVILDQFFLDAKAGGPGEDWAKWSTDQANQTQRVIIIGSESWFLCYDGKQPPGTGLGGACEARNFRRRIYQSPVDHPAKNQISARSKSRRSATEPPPKQADSLSAPMQ